MIENPWNNLDRQREKKTPWWSSRVALVLLLATVIVVGLVVFWNFIVSHGDDVDEANIPVIVAETLTMKERPEKTVMEEGDSVYGLISREQSKGSSLKSDIEEPLHETSFQSTSEEKENISQSEVINMDTPLVRENRDSTPKKQNPVRQDMTNKTESFFLQVSSLPSNKEAEGEIARLQKKHLKAAESLSFKIIRKEVPNKGIYFRVYAGPFETKMEANKMCQNLSQGKGPCLVVLRSKLE